LAGRMPMKTASSAVKQAVGYQLVLPGRPGLYRKEFQINNFHSSAPADDLTDLAPATTICTPRCYYCALSRRLAEEYLCGPFIRLHEAVRAKKKAKTASERTLLPEPRTALDNSVRHHEGLA
jgi:biotin synthase-like enzyme